LLFQQQIKVGQNSLFNPDLPSHECLSRLECHCDHGLLEDERECVGLPLEREARLPTEVALKGNGAFARGVTGTIGSALP
jgi:hypothetical protein